MISNKKMLNRVLAMILTVALIITMLPVGMLQAFAATEDYEDMLTFTVTDSSSGEAIKGATVKIELVNLGAFNETWTNSTDAKGVVSFQEYTALRENALNFLDYTIEYTITADGYLEATGTFTGNSSNNFVDNIEVALELELDQIPDSDYTIIGFDGMYDGNAHSVIVTTDGYNVQYSEDGSIYSSVSPSITDVGEKKVYVQISKEGYETIVKEVTLKVTAAERTDFAFLEEVPEDIDYVEGLIFENIASSTLEPQKVAYSSSDETIGKVDENGVVSFLKAGTVTITAIMEASTNYKESTANYTITVNTLPRSNFYFTISNPSEITYGDGGNEFTNEAIDVEEDGTIVYSIDSQQRDGKIVNDVAIIDSKTGKLTITASGTVVVKAVVTGGNIYDNAETKYSLTIKRAAQTGFAFEESVVENLEYGQEYKNVLLGEMGVGELIYEIVSGDTIVSLKNDGTIKAIGIGEAVIKVKKAFDSRYEEATAEYMIKTIKANQTGFDFISNPYEVSYGTRNLTVEVVGGQSTGSVTYSIISGNDIAELENETNGVVKFKSQQDGTVTVQAIKAGDDFYNEVNATAVINVVRIEASSKYSISGNKGSNGWYIGDIEFIPAEGYQISTADDFEAGWEEKLSLKNEGTIDQFNIYLKKSIGQGKGSISNAIPVGPFNIDKTNPSIPVVSYSQTFLNVLENIFFFQSKVTVTVETEDTVSGIDYVECETGKEKIIISGDKFEDGKESFTIESQYKGQLKVTVVDKAGRLSSIDEEKTIVVDDDAPIISVDYVNNNVTNSSYYSADREAIIKIKEDNFYEEDVVITVGKRLNNEENYTETREYPKFTFDEKFKAYVATITFNEDADYTFDISYTDKSGNTYDSYEKDEFTIDKIDPIIYSSGIENGVYYTDDQILTIKVKEHNFDPALIEFDIKAKKADGLAIDLSDKMYIEYLKDINNWTKEGDIYTANIKLDIEGQYEVNMKCTDLAGRKSGKEINIPFFCIDKTNPREDSMKISYSESITDFILEKITFGFYQAPVKVTIEAVDEIAGIDRLEYVYDVKDGESSINVGGDGAEEIKDNKAIVTFEIPAQFRGHVSFTAIDKAGRSTSYTDETNEIVVDTIAPGVSVKFPTDKAKNGNYYVDSTTAIIEINEANFYDSDVIITIQKRLNDEVDYTESRISPKFTKDTEKEDSYIAEIVFDEDADYIFDIEYTDKSGNVYDEYEAYEFTVDKIAPVITISYDNNDVLNETKFKADRTATIKIEEHNFNVADVIAVVTVNDIEDESYTQHFKDIENWSKVGDVYTTEITFSNEADYTFDIECTDLAGLKNEDINYVAGTAAPTEFTVDKTKPTASIQIGSWSEIWTDFPEGDNDNRSFGLWDNKAVKIVVDGSDELSGIDTIEYFRSNEILTLSEVKTSDAWIKFSEREESFSYEVEPDERFVVYVHVIDKAGNEHYVSSEGIILDSSLPDVEKVSPEVTVTPNVQPINGIYNTDVLMDVTVIDPIEGNDVFSGLKSVKYKIYNNSLPEGQKVTEVGDLFIFDNNAPQKDDLVQSYEKAACIRVDKVANNSNDVVVEITATDNAGNITTKVCNLKIDITAPTIDVDYDNNSADSGKFFKAERTAQVVISERNFDPNKVKITISNTEGVIPTVSTWKESKGTGNLDDTTWTATINYVADGDYEFDIAFVDEAGNECEGVTYATGTVAGVAFTIDKTIPVISVSYDNNNALNGNYYKNTRTATLVITEHNLEPNGVDRDRVAITMTATDDGAVSTIPNVTTWTTNGDTHTATITYNSDAMYTFDVTIRDKAGNESVDFEQQTFYIDKTAPILEITGVENNSANNGDVIPVVTYSDTNFNSEQVTITLVGANRDGVGNNGFYTEIHNGQVFTFNNFAKEKEVDDIYTLTATLTDMAGNTTTKTITFSVNRFGSNYTMSEETKKINGTYTQNPIDVVITETNANELQNIKITLFKNNETITLVEEEDYKIDVTGGNGEWYNYTYTVYAKNFADDGVYRITVHSEDTAGNVAENTLDTKNTEVSFGVDNTPPTFVVTNLESGETYPVENMTVSMSASDNLLLSQIVVYLDDYDNVYKSWTEEEITKIIAENGEFTFDITGDSKKAHKVKIVCIDAAGKETVEEITDFYVTTDIWVRYYNNKPLFFGSIAGTITTIGIIIFFIAYRRKKEENNN